MQGIARGTVYLAGPITHAGSYEGATDWREQVSAWMRDLRIHTYSPMRGKTFLADDWNLKGDGSYDHVLSTPAGIVGRDRLDVTRCDVMLAYFPVETEKASIGTAIEYGWASMLNTPIVTVREPGSVHDHAMLNQLSTYIVSDLEEGVALADALIG